MHIPKRINRILIVLIITTMLLPPAPASAAVEPASIQNEKTAAFAPGAAQSAKTIKAQALEAYGQLPLSFLPYGGQANRPKGFWPSAISGQADQPTLEISISNTVYASITESDPSSAEVTIHPDETVLEISASNTVSVSITESGLNPAEVTIHSGDTVHWTNYTTQTQTIVPGIGSRVFLPLIMRDSGSAEPSVQSEQREGSQGLSEPRPTPESLSEFTGRTPVLQGTWQGAMIAPGASYSHTFTETGECPYHIASHPNTWVGKVVVEAPSPDFVIDATPDARMVTQGEATTYTVMLTATNGFTAPVALSVTGLPAGVTPTWGENPITPSDSTALTITSDTAPVGDYTLTITGNGDGISHADSVQLSILSSATLPDLIVTDLSVTPITPTLGQPATLTIQVENQGTVSTTANVRVDAYVDPAAPPGTGDVGDVFTTTGWLDAGQSSVVQLPQTFTTGGPQTLYAQVDALQAVNESVEGNNVHGPISVTVQVPQPDLVIEDITFEPDIPFVGETVTVTVTVHNQGDAPAGPFRTDWYVDPTSPPSAAETGDGYWNLPGLGVGITANLTLTHSFATTGTHRLYAQVDTLNAVTESLETNNVDGESLVVVDTAVDMCGNVVIDTTWHAGTLYRVTCDVTVLDGVTLTIEPDVVVKVDQYDGFNIRGTLVVTGTEGHETLFSADTNTPSPGYWDGIRIYGTGSVLLDHVKILYAGRGDYPALHLYEDDGALEITSSVIRYSSTGGIGSYYGARFSRLVVESSQISNNEGNGVYVYGDSARFTDNTFSNNTGIGLGVNGASPTIVNNVFGGNGSYAASAWIQGGGFVIDDNAATSNGYDGIALEGYLTASTVMRRDPNWVYILGNPRLDVNEGVTLTIESDVVVKGEPSSELDVSGNLIAHGTQSDPIVFTSLKDDTYGGDTNGDGDATSPGTSDWSGIEIYGTGVVSFDHVHFMYATHVWGSNPPHYEPAIRLEEDGGSLSVTNSVIRYNGAGGAGGIGTEYSARYSQLVITSSQISDNEGSGISAGGDYVLIQDCEIFGNTGYGVGNTDSSTIIHAENNWWGSYDGPAPYGSGNGINYRTCYDDGTPYICEFYVDANPWTGKDYWDAYHAGQDVHWNGYEAEPVNTANGNYTYEHADLTIPARGDLRLDFVRSYNSSYPQDGPLGYGWSHSYDISVSEVVTEAFISHADGRQDRFVWNGSTYEPNPGTFSTLVKENSTFTLTLKDKTVYAFDAMGRLDRILDRNGNALVLAYTGNRLSTVTAPGGLALAFGYDLDGHITSVTDPVGRSIGFTYNISDDLTVVTDTRGFATTFTYNGDHRMLTATDANGATFVRNTYDDQGRVVEQRDALNNLTTFTYYEIDRITVATDPYGNATTYEYDSNLRLSTQTNALGDSMYFTYDAHNNRTASTDERGFTTCYAYDDRGNVTAITDTLGYVTTMLYDGQDNLLQVTDPRGNSTFYAYDEHGNLITRTDALDSVMVSTFDEYGQLISRIDEASHTTLFGYDVYGHQTVVTNAMGYATQQVYDPAGRLLSETDALGHTTTYAYDAANHTVAVTNTLNQVTLFTYDPTGHQTAAQDAMGMVITYTYDLKGRLIAESDGAGHLTRYSYDALDRRVVMTDALGYTTHYGYGALGHLIVIADALGGTIHYTYDAAGNQTSVTDANGNTTNYGFDALGRTVVITDALGGVTRYGFDEAGNRTMVTDANSHATTMGYDPLDRLVWASDPLSRMTQYGYDPLGHLTVITKADGTVITQDYDSLGQLTLRNTPDGTTTYQYDAVGNRIAMTDATGTTWYTYDELGQLVGVTQPGSAPIAYTYDAAGNRTHLAYPDGKVVTYTYGAAHRLTEVTDWAGRAVHYTYDALGHVVTQQNPNGTTVTSEYDALGRTVAITHESIVSGTLAFFNYAYDAVGNRLVMMDSLGTTGYQYDALYRISRVDYPDGEAVTYAYDPMGNRLSMTSTVHGAITYTYDAADQLLASGSITFTWDLNGNLVARSGVSYTWDDLNRLTAVISGTDVVTFTYDGAGVRVAKSVNGTETTYVQDVGLLLPYVLEETDSSGTMRYVYGLDLFAHETPAGAPFYYHQDALGSTRHLSNQGGQSVMGYAYDVFGAVRWTSGSPGTDFTFTGEQGDPTTGLYFLRARYYDPALGRFISKDAFPAHLAWPQTLNRYVYCANNPINYIDPSGEDFLKDLKGFLVTNEEEVNAWADVIEHTGATLKAFGVPAVGDVAGSVAEDIRFINECANGGHKHESFGEFIREAGGEFIARQVPYLGGLALDALTAGSYTTIKPIVKGGGKFGLQGIKHGLLYSMGHESAEQMAEGMGWAGLSFSADFGERMGWWGKSGSKAFKGGLHYLKSLLHPEPVYGYDSTWPYGYADMSNPAAGK